jgi:hypothetical protein
MTDQSIEDASRKEFQQWLKDTGRGWSEIAFEAWKAKAARQSSQSEPVASLEEWLVTNMPAGTVIGDPKWWARKINNVLGYLAAPQQAIPSGWISVDDTLPSNPEERVLAIETDGEVYRLYYRDGKWLDIDGYELLAVHAWMEFPEVYDLSASPTSPQQAIPSVRLAEAEAILKHFVANSYCQDVGGGDLTVTTCEALEMATAYLSASPTAPIDNVARINKLEWVIKQIADLDPQNGSIGTAVFMAKEALIPDTQANRTEG